jgi:hypothetical protein
VSGSRKITEPLIMTAYKTIAKESHFIIITGGSVRKRVSETPMEIMTGKKREKNWTEPLFDLIEEKNPHFFSAAD